MDVVNKVSSERVRPLLYALHFKRNY